MTRRRHQWYDHMRMGSAVTLDPDKVKRVTFPDRIILRLLRGPALESEFGIEGYVPDYVTDANLMLRPAGRHIDSEKVKVLSAHGLTMKVRKYTMVRT